jgi:hypothetical protein
LGKQPANEETSQLREDADYISEGLSPSKEPRAASFRYSIGAKVGSLSGADLERRNN